MKKKVNWSALKKEFIEFAANLKVETKEKGLVRLGTAWLGTQTYVIDEIFKGLQEGIHFFVVLKGRQQGITTLTLALDLFWHYKFNGLSGTLVTDTDESREMFRETFKMYIDSLPNAWKVPTAVHNRAQVVFRNRSRMAYQVAGTKKKEKRSVGVGKAIVYMHATECSNWGDDGALADIQSSLAQSNPNRLFVWESTARGQNEWEEMYTIAKHAASQRAIFVGWWRNQLYEFKPGDNEYEVYWDGRMTAEEAARADDVLNQYEHVITPGQIAWWRWMVAEKIIEGEGRALQEHPWTAEDAFRSTGSAFFTNGAITNAIKVTRTLPYEPLAITFGSSIGETRILEATEETCTLKVWEQPVDGAWYVVGGDPAFGSSEWKDQFCAQVFRVYTDGMEQVAEFCDTEMTPQLFGWLLLYLCGAYNTGRAGEPHVMLNLEINGPGMAVWSEIQNMRRQVGLLSMEDGGIDPRLAAVCMNISDYLYKRPDSMGGGYAWHFKTDASTKERMLTHFKDGFEMGQIIVRSEYLVREMGHVERKDGDIAAQGRKKDDRVIAAGLGVVAW